MTSSTQALPAARGAGSAGPTPTPRRPKDRAQTTFYWMVWPAVIAFAAFHTLPSCSTPSPCSSASSSA